MENKTSKSISRPFIFLLIIFAIIFFAYSAYWICLPSDLFTLPKSTVLYSSEGRLLNARTSSDEQWRFPYNPEVPGKFAKSLLMFEDKYFYYHRGVNPFSLVRALYTNIRSGRTISGGSTISMQVIRLHRQGRPRTITEKLIEIVLATRLELTYSKNEILAMYASNAPFGGNIVGLDAACWRYFNQPPENLSWGQAASLAVLPNSPALVHPGRNRQILLEKRNMLLSRLYDSGYIDKMELKLSLAEPLPKVPYALPQHAPHLFDRIRREGLDGKNIHSTLNADFQLIVNKIAERHHLSQKQNHVNNIAILVCETKSGNVLAYTGNIYNKEYPTQSMYVDIITRLRSPGSILKPFLYAAMLSDGYILPQTLVADIPTNFKGFSPENFHRNYDGAVPASRALSRSLNVPAVKMLQDYSPEKFLDFLKEAGFTSFTKPASHYGLSLILGGAEVSLWEITGLFASMGRLLLEYNAENKYNNKVFRPLNYLENNDANVDISPVLQNIPISAGSAYHTISALNEVNRPDEEIYWREFSSMFPVAWKTGTSYGNRDAWSIGITPEYTVGVWVGNASGEGRPELTGINAAAPVLFDVYKILKPRKWFTPPYDDMKQIVICKHSGHRAKEICTDKDTVWVPIQGLSTIACPYHQIIHLDKKKQFRVNASCESIRNIKPAPWFILPPVKEFYFVKNNPFYKKIPPLRSDCKTQADRQNIMDLIYPPENAKVFIPIEIDGSPGEIVFQLAHRNDNSTVFWHINDEFIGSSSVFHEVSIRPAEGHHKLIVVDESGETITRNFEVVSKNR